MHKIKYSQKNVKVNTKVKEAKVKPRESSREKALPVKIRPKKILFICPKNDLSRGNFALHTQWAVECKNVLDVNFWGRGWGNTSLNSLRNKIDAFCPDYIYLTDRRHCRSLPNLSSIKVPKIFVEVDTCYFKPDDQWYRQFDQLYCRSHAWNHWQNVPILKWSISKTIFPDTNNKREGVYFVGSCNHPKNIYAYRKFLKKELEGLVVFKEYVQGNSRESLNSKTNLYYEVIKKALVLLCPTENNYGDYVPAKFFEFVAAGAAVLTNCDIAHSNIPELDEYIIKYTDLEDLKYKLNSGIDFASYCNKCIPIMRNYTHDKIYQELFV